MITRAEIYLIGLIVLAASLAGMWFFAKHEGRLEERAVWEAKQAAATKADLDSLTSAVNTAADIARGTQELLNKGRAKSVIDRGVIEREIKTNVVYASNCFPPSGIVRWNDISAGRALLPDSTAGQQPDPAVPNPNGAAGSGQQGRNPLAKPSSSARGVR